MGKSGVKISALGFFAVVCIALPLLSAQLYIKVTVSELCKNRYGEKNSYRALVRDSVIIQAQSRPSGME